MDLTEFEVYGSGTGPRTSSCLSFNNFQGHLLANDERRRRCRGAECDTPAGETADCRRRRVPRVVRSSSFRATEPNSTITAAAGDLIGVDVPVGAVPGPADGRGARRVGLDVSASATTSSTRALTELPRMQEGGCHPTDGCYFADDDTRTTAPTSRTSAANVVDKNTDGHVRAAGHVDQDGRRRQGRLHRNDAGGHARRWSTRSASRAVNFKDEVETANDAGGRAEGARCRGDRRADPRRWRAGSAGHVQRSATASPGRSSTIAQDLDPEIDVVITGHTHQPYVCTIDDPAGNPRMVTSAASYGQVLTVSHLKVDPTTGEVDRARSYANNQLVTRNAVAKDAGETDIINFWQPLATALGNQVVGKVNSTSSVTRAPAGVRRRRWPTWSRTRSCTARRRRRTVEPRRADEHRWCPQHLQGGHHQRWRAAG